VCSSRLIAWYVMPSASARISRPRKTSPAGKVRDCDHRVNSSRCPAVSETNSRCTATYQRRNLLPISILITGTDY
jgi:hypothetical protein